MFTLIIADDEKAACKRLELFTKREFPDIEIVAIVDRKSTRLNSSHI